MLYSVGFWQKTASSADRISPRAAVLVTSLFRYSSQVMASHFSASGASQGLSLSLMRSAAIFSNFFPRLRYAKISAGGSFISPECVSSSSVVM